MWGLSSLTRDWTHVPCIGRQILNEGKFLITGPPGKSLFLVFWGTFILFFIMAPPIYIPTSSVLGFPFLHILTNIWRLFDDSHSDRCEVIIISLWFWFAFLWWLAILSISSCACWPLCIFFGKMSIQVFCPIFNWVIFLYWVVWAVYTFCFFVFCFFYKFIYFIYLFLAVLGPRCCARALSSRGEQGLLFIAVRGPLIAAASPVAEHGL